MSYIELYDPEQGDEQEVEGDEEAEGPPHVRDALLLAGVVRLHPRIDGRGVDWRHRSAGQPWIGAATASAVHPPWPRPLSRASPAHWSTEGGLTGRDGGGGSSEQEVRPVCLVDVDCGGKLHHSICREEEARDDTVLFQNERLLHVAFVFTWQKHGWQPKLPFSAGCQQKRLTTCLHPASYTFFKF